MTFADIVNKTIVPFANDIIIPFLYMIAFLAFIFGIFKFFFTGGEENRKQGKDFALWGIIGFVVLFSVWTLVQLLLDSILPTSLR